jgi:hypothetical protein
MQVMNSSGLLPDQVRKENVGKEVMITIPPALVV